jgi:hypothetical protein
MVEPFGSGIYLDSQLDFSVDPTSDIQTSSGVDELEKDLSIAMIVNLQQFLGRPPSGNLETKVFTAAKNVALGDTRVLRVNSNRSDISFSDNREKINIIMAVKTRSGEQELVFNVE